MMHWWGNGYGMGYGWGWMFMIVFWVLIILGIVYLVKGLSGGSQAGNGRLESPEEVLKKRFARGEISKEELESSLEVLRKHQ